MLYLSRYTKRAILGGVISMLTIFTGIFLLGELSGYKAKELIQNSIQGMNTLCNTIVLASATILALLLTLLSLSTASNSKLKKDHYRHVMQIAKLDTYVFVASMISFLLFNLPVTESDDVPNSWFSMIYYSSLIVSSVLSAALIVVVLMLYNTVTSIIRIVGLNEKDHPLTISEKEE